MAAVVDSIVEGAPPPGELRLAWQCQRWGALPRAGGIYDQDYKTMMLMGATLNIYNSVTRVRSLKGKEIHRLNDAERKVLRVLMDNKIIFHA